MKTTNFVILTILACGLAMATDVVNLATQSHSPPITVGNTMGVTTANNLPLLLANGWRVVPAVPPVADGYVRSQVTYAEGDGTNATAQYTDTSLAVIAAQQAAQNAVDASNAAAQASATAQAFTNQTLPLLVAYRTILRAYFGPGAETNYAVTTQSVPAYFLSITNPTPQQSMDASRIMFLFNALSPRYMGEMHNAPWQIIP